MVFFVFYERFKGLIKGINSLLFDFVEDVNIENGNLISKMEIRGFCLIGIVISFSRLLEVFGFKGARRVGWV